MKNLFSPGRTLIHQSDSTSLPGRLRRRNDGEHTRLVEFFNSVKGGVIRGESHEGGHRGPRTGPCACPATKDINSPSSAGFTPHLRAFAVIAPSPGCARIPPERSFMRADLDKKSRPPPPFHRSGVNGATNSPVVCSQRRKAVEQIGFPQAIHEGRTMPESIFRNLSMMSRWLRSVFVRAVRGQRGGGMGMHMECDMTGETRTPKPGGTAERTPDVEFPKISIKFDKFPKLFMGQTNIKSGYDIVSCQDILKYYIKYFRKFSELKKFFRIPHFPAFAKRSASGHRAPGRSGGRLPGRALWPARRSQAQARCPKVRARCRSKGPRALPPR